MANAHQLYPSLFDFPPNLCMFVFQKKIAMSLKGKKIILGITGSIAAYKAALLIRLFIKKGAEVQVIITPSGKEFITPLTLSTLSNKPVISEFFTANDGTWHSHVDLGLWADLMLIAPATAATIGKMANGVADNMLITTYLSMKAPVFLAPAMDLDMFKHITTTENLEKLKSHGVTIIEPTVGELASHLEGKGRMEEPENIVQVVENFFSKQQTLHKKKVLITAGPTYERIDPVRFIGNFSTGKMGFALAEACADRGAEVILVSGPTALSVSNPLIQTIHVESAQEMRDAALAHFAETDIAIFSAAVADYRPKELSNRKLKRKENEQITLHLTPNPDIAATLGAQKKEGQLLIGFALETNDEEMNALKKMEKKNLDYIVLNSLNDEGAGFGHDTNKITLIARDGNQWTSTLKSKKEIAEDIVKTIESYYAVKTENNET